jgi:hypothetical protein
LTTPPLVSATDCNEAGNCTTRKWTTILLRFYYSNATQLEIRRKQVSLHSTHITSWHLQRQMFCSSFLTQKKASKNSNSCLPPLTRKFCQKYIKLTTKPTLLILTETFTIQITTHIRIAQMRRTYSVARLLTISVGTTQVNKYNTNIYTTSHQISHKTYK